MIGRDLLFRGRGTDVGVRAPAWLVRVGGAALAVGIGRLADALGLWAMLGVPRWMTTLGAMAIGAVAAPTAVGGVLWLAAGALTALLLVVMFTPITRPMVAPFVRADQAGSPVDAVMVLSGGVTEDGRMTGQALDRLLSALMRVRERGVGELALSVVQSSGPMPRLSSEADQRALAQLGAPQVTVRFVHDVHGTRDEALAFAAMARTHGWTRVMVVTSPMHSRRACQAFEKTGLAVECRPADGRDYSVRRLQTSEDRRLAFADVVYEVAAAALYRARGWM